FLRRLLIQVFLAILRQLRRFNQQSAKIILPFCEINVKQITGLNWLFLRLQNRICGDCEEKISCGVNNIHAAIEDRLEVSVISEDDIGQPDQKEGARAGEGKCFQMSWKIADAK